MIYKCCDGNELVLTCLSFLSYQVKSSNSSVSGKSCLMQTLVISYVLVFHSMQVLLSSRVDNAQPNLYGMFSVAWYLEAKVFWALAVGRQKNGEKDRIFYEIFKYLFRHIILERWIIFLWKCCFTPSGTVTRSTPTPFYRPYKFEH